MLISVGLGLLSAASWGAGDFCGGLASRRANVYAVTLTSHATGFLLLLGLAIASGEPWLSAADVAWSALAGLCGSLGLLALYRALAQRRMGVAAPLSAVLAAALPVLVSALVEGLPDRLAITGFALALAGVWLLSRPEAEGFRPGDLSLPLVAGAGFGLFFVLIDQVSASGPFLPLVVTRVASLTLLSTTALARRQPLVPERSAWRLVLLAGVLDTGGNVFFKLAAQAGRLDTASVLASLYPAATVLLALLVLRERLTRTQVAGVAAALAAILLISASSS